MKKKNQPKFALARIKKIIQNNEEIGKISHSIPFLVSKSLELFLNNFLTKIVDTAKDQDKVKLSGSVIKKVVDKDGRLSFLKPVLKDISDAEDEKPSKKPKSKKNKSIEKKEESIDDEEEFEEEKEINVVEKIKKSIKKERKPKKNKKDLQNDEDF